MTSVAVMQPYFMPYAGYFGLIAAVDLFIVFDCVQFPRRGWVHRNQLADADGKPKWLTLPIEKAPREVRICDLKFAPDAEQRFSAQLNSFPALQPPDIQDDPLIRAVQELKGRPLDYNIKLLELACQRLKIPFEFVCSSALDVDPDLAGQERVLALAKIHKADRYVNLPGGRSIYDREVFMKQDLQLDFLPAYSGPQWSILQRLFSEDNEQLRQEIIDYVALGG
jgi:WbqC-like protein